jgi:hypothetical protein
LTRLAGSFILDTTYGLDVNNKDDKYIDQAERGMAAMAAGGTPGYLVDLIPSLKYLPSWLPGAQFKRDAKVWSRDVSAMPRDCLRFVEDGLVCRLLPCCPARKLTFFACNDDRNGVMLVHALLLYCLRNSMRMMANMSRGRAPSVMYLALCMQASGSQALPSPELMVSSPQRGPILYATFTTSHRLMLTQRLL